MHCAWAKFLLDFYRFWSYLVVAVLQISFRRHCKTHFRETVIGSMLFSLAGRFRLDAIAFVFRGSSLTINDHYCT